MNWPAFWRGFRDGFCMGPLVRWVARRLGKEVQR